MTLAFQGSICAQILGTKVCRPCQSGAYHWRVCAGPGEPVV